MEKAVYPGSFDPITLGHLDVIEQSARLFDCVVVAVLENPEKRPWFPVDERVALIQESVRRFPNIQVDSFQGLLVEYVRRTGARAVIRGVRGPGDFENELRMAQMNRSLDDRATTLMIATKAEFAYISSSLIRDIASHGGEVAKFVPQPVAKAMQRKTMQG